MRSSSAVAVTDASTSKVTRRPSTAAASRMRPLGRSRFFELRAHDLTEVPRQRLEDELIRVELAGGREQLLEEERVAAGARVQRLDDAERRWAAGTPRRGTR